MLDREVNEDRGHGLQPQPSRRHEPLVPTYDGAVLASDDDRVDKPELPDASRERV